MALLRGESWPMLKVSHRPIAILLVGLGCIGLPALAAGQKDPSSSGSYGVRAHQLIGQYCIVCHSKKLRTGGIVLEGANTTDLGIDAELWEKVAAKVLASEMPPKGMPRPAAPVLHEFGSWLESGLDALAAASPNPGSVPIHRLDRAEYQNAVRDLLGLQIDARSLLVADDADQHGFENIAGVLSVSPALAESYVSSAGKISRLAVGDPNMVPVFETYKISKMTLQDDRMGEDLPFGTRGGIAIHHRFPLDAEYVVRIKLRRQLYDYIVGLGHPQTLEVRLDGARLKEFTVGGEEHGTPAPATFAGEVLGSSDWEEYLHSADANLALRFPAKAGTHIVGVSFVAASVEPEGVWQRRGSPQGLAADEMFSGNAAVDSVAIGGPYHTTGMGQTLSRKRIFICLPAGPSEELSCARRIVTNLARRAYRRPVGPVDVETLLEFYKAGRRQGGFESGIQRAVERVLVDPDFLFRIEHAPQGVRPGGLYRVSDFSLASRLSFFLWSSIPDEELWREASHGKLKDPAVLDQEVERMLSDDRSAALIQNFATQWLGLEKVQAVSPDPVVFPEFDDSLREGFEKETQLFLANQIRADRPVPELLDSSYTYLNERLARHYGIPDVYGSHFRRVSLAKDSERGGLLGEGSLLLLTSYPNRTSPVLRGKWLLDNILGAPPPPPPPDVPALKETRADGKPTSIRAQMEEHRKNPACAGCHTRMDPLGFSLENFDAVGKWRTVDDGGMPIDASASLPDGTKFDGLQGLRSLMRNRREEFVRTFTEKLLTYAIGREVEYYDLPAVRRIVRAAAANDYRWSSIISGIVKSIPFQIAVAGDEGNHEGASR